MLLEINVKGISQNKTWIVRKEALLMKAYNSLSVLLAATVSSLYLIPSSVRADGVLCEKTFTPPITTPSAFAEAMTKGMVLSKKQTDLWHLYRNRWFGDSKANIGQRNLSDVFQILKKHPKLSKLPIQEQIIQFSIRDAMPRDENFTSLLNRFIRINLNKINNLYQIEDHLNFWTTIMIYPKMSKQNSVSKAQRKILKQQYNQEFLAYLENFINSEKRQFTADSSNDRHTRVVALYHTLEKIRAFLEEQGKNTMPISKAMVDVVETAGFTSEFYVNQLKSSNTLENIEGLQNILEERDIIAFNLGFQKGRFSELKESLLKQQSSTIAEANEKNSLNQNIEEQLIEIAEKTANQAQTMKNISNTLRLRALSLQESAFRSCLGGDCTTRIYFELAFDPNFLFFTLTDSQHTSSGQITVVLGESKDAKGESIKTAFVDNIHNVPLNKIYPMLEGISLSLSEHGYKLSLPKNVNLEPYGLSDHRRIIHYLKTKIAPHLTRELTQFKPHKNDYPFQKKYYRRDLHRETLIEFDKVDQQNSGFNIRPGSIYTPQQSPDNLSSKILYEEIEEILSLPRPKTEEDQIRFINILSDIITIEEFNTSKGFVRDHLISMIQDKEVSFKVKKLSLYTLIQFELEHNGTLNIRVVESLLEYFTENEKNSIIGEMSTWKESHQSYRRSFITIVLMNSFRNNSGQLINLLKLSSLESRSNIRDIFLKAISSNNKYIFDILLKNKIDVNMRDPLGRTPLHHAVFYRDIDTTTHLLEHGADPNIQDHDGKTPLHLAIRWGSLERVKLMLEHGADPNIRDHNGKTPLHLAIDDRPQAITLLMWFKLKKWTQSHFKSLNTP